MKAAAFVLILFLTAGVAYAKEFTKEEKAGDHFVIFKIDNLKVGANKVTIQVKDPSGVYVRDAKVQINYAMPEGIDLPPMHFAIEAIPGGNTYNANMKIPMPGTWDTSVIITQGGKTSSMKFRVEAVRE